MFDTYEDAFAHAQSSANASGFSYGLERLPGPMGGWHVFMLPAVANRYGHELRCQEVRCMDFRDWTKQVV
jgi:hypothetical protein